MEQTFEQFLQEIHIKTFPQILDDDLPDAFDNWIGELTAEDWIEYGDFYGRLNKIKGKEEILLNK